jgi:hypothetical protein
MYIANGTIFMFLFTFFDKAYVVMLLSLLLHLDDISMVEADHLHSIRISAFICLAVAAILEQRYNVCYIILSCELEFLILIILKLKFSIIICEMNEEMKLFIHLDYDHSVMNSAQCHELVIRLGVSISPTSSQTENRRLFMIVVCSTSEREEHIVGHHHN